MSYTPIPQRLPTKRPSLLPVVLVVAMFALMGWVQSEDQAALEKERATIKQLAREKAGMGCDTTVGDKQ